MPQVTAFDFPNTGIWGRSGWVRCRLAASSTPSPLSGLWGGQPALVVCSNDDGDDDLDIGDDDSLTADDSMADEESSFDDFDDDFDDDFEEEETDPDWDHPDDLQPEAPPPGKPSGGKK